MTRRRVATVVVVVVSCMAATACARHLSTSPPPTTAPSWNDVLPSPSTVDPSTSTTPAPTRGPTITPATTSPTGRRSATTTAPGPPTTTARTPTAADLRAALLSASDLPRFVNDNADDDPNGSTANCPVLDDDFSGQANAAAQALFKQSDSGPFIRERLRQLGTDRARNAVATIADIPHRCPSFTDQDPNLGTVHFTVTSLGVPQIGDGTAAFRLTMRPDAAPAVLYENVLVIRRGGTIILITHTGINSIDNGLTTSCGSRAYTKTERVW